MAPIPFVPARKGTRLMAGIMGQRPTARHGKKRRKEVSNCGHHSENPHSKIICPVP
jgi:hypothetical protein